MYIRTQPSIRPMPRRTLRGIDWGAFTSALSATVTGAIKDASTPGGTTNKIVSVLDPVANAVAKGFQQGAQRQLTPSGSQGAGLTPQMTQANLSTGSAFDAIPTWGKYALGLGAGVFALNSVRN